MFGLTKRELQTLRRLNTPRKIQDFLEELPSNHEPTGDTCMSPRMVLKTKTAHCIEGAMLAALALRLHGHKPLLVDLTAAPFDDDHVIAVFKQHGHWGAITKTNHAVLRYREPVYKNIHELVMSFFHEYSDYYGRKSLRSYSNPVDLSRFDKLGWMTSTEDLWYVPEHLVDVKHIHLLTRAQIATLRPIDPIEHDAGDIVQWKRRRHR